MKNPGTVSTSTIIILVAAGIILFLFHRKQVNRLKKTIAIESAKAEFIRQSIPTDEFPFDSVYAKDDTISFYKKSALVRKSFSLEK